ncbi:MAG: hypothetical protein SGJ27_16590 [Candidatus Melainabacteria bacterium]|nr:hypothetical protein [Candidatus Melainabacteria bacterium]
MSKLKPNLGIITGSGREGLPDYAQVTMDMILSEPDAAEASAGK